MHSETAQGLLTELGRSIGMPDLQLDESGLCELVIDGQWCITVAHHRPRNCLILYCAICPAEAVEKMDRSTMLMMLKGNFLGGGARGAVFAVDTDGRAGLQLELPLGQVADQALLHGIGLIVHEAEAWSTRLADSASAPEPTAPRSRPPRIKMMA